MMSTSRHERHSSRYIDIIIHGATGYTGKRVVRHLASKHPNLNIAICGRNRAKLLAVAKEIGWDEVKCTSSIFVVADIVENKSELVAAFSKAKALLACSGPYRSCGLPILQAAIEAKCDYLDLCGEPQYFDDALTAFDREARDAGVLAVHAAAFDCVPAELGSNLAERELLKKYSNEDNIQCAGIEIVHTLQNVSSANATIFHAAVDGFYAASSGELKASRKKVKDSYPEFDETKAPKRPDIWPRFQTHQGLCLDIMMSSPYAH